MSMKGKTLLKGHTLLFEGKALGYSMRRTPANGVGGCSCGARSEELPCNAARQRWHKEHKESMKHAAVENKGGK